GRSRSLCDGPRRLLLQSHRRRASEVQDAWKLHDCSLSLVGDIDLERLVRAALQFRDFWELDSLRDDRSFGVRPSAETSRHAPPVSRDRLPCRSLFICAGCFSTFRQHSRKFTARVSNGSRFYGRGYPTVLPLSPETCV